MQQSQLIRLAQFRNEAMLELNLRLRKIGHSLRILGRVTMSRYAVSLEQLSWITDHQCLDSYQIGTTINERRVLYRVLKSYRRCFKCPSSISN